jgi:hypothetical protein
VPRHDQRNLKEWDSELEAWRPSWNVMNKFVMGADPAKYEAQEVSGKKKSYNAGAIFYKRDMFVYLYYYYYSIIKSKVSTSSLNRG